MKSSFPKKLLALKNRLFGWLGIFLFFFSVADSTFLQYYSGNETLGILSYSRAAMINQEPNHGRKNLTQLAFAAPGRSCPDQQPGSESNHSDCICSCAHVLTTRFHSVTSPAAVVFEKQVHTTFPKSAYSESHLSSLFRPPRLA